VSATSKIEWTDATWNPMLGCDKISPGCKNCYAIKDVHRMAGNPNPKIAAANQGLTVIEGGHPNWTGEVRFLPERLTIPLRRKKPTRYFVNSLSDLFHKGFTDEQILSVFQTIGKCPRHIFQILTKRPERTFEFLRERHWRNLGHSPAMGGDHYVSLILGDHRDGKSYERDSDCLPNVWLGVSAETQQRADERIPHLLKTPAAVRFVSLEPLLGPINLRYALPRTEVETYHGDPWREPGVDWVIVGGESGPGARPCETDWIRDILRQCKDAGVPCFVKQLGADPLLPRNTILHPPARRTLKLRDRKGGNMEEWPADLRVREMPRAATCANS
jgi:protein gp37